MTRENHEFICKLGLSYFSGECSIQEQEAFKRHLPECQNCQSEMNDMHIVWEAMNVDIDQVEPPKELKKQVLDAVVGTDSVEPEFSRVRKTDFRFRTWMGSTTAAVLVMLVLGIIWNNNFIDKQETAAVIPIEQALSVSAAQIEKLIPLNPVSYYSSSAYGIACIVNNGSNKQFIVYIFDAKETIDDQAYQVWLISDNERRSAGTFRVDGQGVGVLAMPITSEDFAFDGISVSLEPDDRGHQPRGTKMLESEI